MVPFLSHQVAHKFPPWINGFHTQRAAHVAIPSFASKLVEVNPRSQNPGFFGELEPESPRGDTSKNETWDTAKPKNSLGHFKKIYYWFGWVIVSSYVLDSYKIKSQILKCEKHSANLKAQAINVLHDWLFFGDPGFLKKNLSDGFNIVQLNVLTASHRWKTTNFWKRWCFHTILGGGFNPSENISQIGSFPHVYRGNNKIIWNRHLASNDPRNWKTVLNLRVASPERYEIRISSPGKTPTNKGSWGRSSTK